MNDIAIKVNNLGKLYRLGQYVGYNTLRESLSKVLSAPFRWKDKKPGIPGSENGKYVWALKDVSFEVKQGEVIGIIGHNGAGKTTLLRVLTRITDPTEGSAEIYGRVGSLLEIGSGFHPELTGRENIYFNGAILGMKKSEITQRLDEIVDFSGVGKFIDTPLKRYSSGMQVRLAFSVAAQMQPDILMVDEVLAVGDAAFQKKCLNKMEDVSKQGRTVLFVSHNMQAIRSLCPRSILFKNGRVALDAPTDDAIAGYYRDMGLMAMDAETSIRNPEKRRGTGDVRFTKIAIQNGAGVDCSTFPMGSTIRFVFFYQVNKTVENLHLIITLRSGKTREIVTNTRHAISDSKLPTGHAGSVTIEFPAATLRPGDYPLYFWLGDSAIYKNYDIVDELTLPIIITTDKSIELLGFNPQQNSGFFNIESRIIDKS